MCFCKNVGLTVDRCVKSDEAHRKYSTSFNLKPSVIQIRVLIRFAPSFENTSSHIGLTSVNFQTFIGGLQNKSRKQLRGEINKVFSLCISSDDVIKQVRVSSMHHYVTYYTIIQFKLILKKCIATPNSTKSFLGKL